MHYGLSNVTIRDDKFPKTNLLLAHFLMGRPQVEKKTKKCNQCDYASSDRPFEETFVNA